MNAAMPTPARSIAVTAVRTILPGAFPAARMIRCRCVGHCAGLHHAPNSRTKPVRLIATHRGRFDAQRKTTALGHEARRLSFWHKRRSEVMPCRYPSAIMRINTSGSIEGRPVWL